MLEIVRAWQICGKLITAKPGNDISFAKMFLKNLCGIV